MLPLRALCGSSRPLHLILSLCEAQELLIWIRKCHRSLHQHQGEERMGDILILGELGPFNHRHDIQVSYLHQLKLTRYLSSDSSRRTFSFTSILLLC